MGVGIVAALYKETYTLPICAATLLYYSATMFHTDTIGKIHRTLSCALCITEIAEGGVLPVLLVVELVFELHRYLSNFKLFWGALCWICIVKTYWVSREPACVFLFFNVYLLVNQLRLEARKFAAFRIDPIFHNLVMTFSEIIKFASLANLAAISYSTHDVASFLGCVGVNMASTKLKGSTSVSLLAHALASDMSPFVVAQWAATMLLGHAIEPLYDFNIVFIYVVDGLFFLRIWYL